MRRNFRKKEIKSVSDKIIIYSAIGVGILAIIVVALLIYSETVRSNMKNDEINLEQMAKIAQDNNQNNQNKEESNNTTITSTAMGKSVEDAQKELSSNTVTDNNITLNGITKNEKNQNTSSNNTNSVSDKKMNSTTNNSVTNTNVLKNKNSNTTSKTETKIENKKELAFAKPVEGEITKEFAKDNLIYSETLKEWTTHMGIDIKAEKTTIVKAAESGTIKSIKNDPRYGLTIVIEHEDGFKTIYANLLTSEFVVEGEKVEKGQSIGTVGNTGVFESADEPHLHFEIIKDSMQVDPNIYLK